VSAGSALMDATFSPVGICDRVPSYPSLLWAFDRIVELP